MKKKKLYKTRKIIHTVRASQIKKKSFSIEIYYATCPYINPEKHLQYDLSCCTIEMSQEWYRCEEKAQFKIHAAKASKKPIAIGHACVLDN